MKKQRKKKAAKDVSLKRLERQVERGSLFTHTIVSRNADRIHETESFLYGAIDVLIDKGMMTQDELVERVQKVRREMEEKGQTVGPGLALRIEGEASGEQAFTAVNCEERLPICKAICCKLHFALTAEEVESGAIKWELGEPYYIRHEANGWCHHLDQKSRGCSIYKNRPGVCKRYSCAEDARIWKDFDQMILNEEWIAEMLRPTQLRIVEAQMLPQQLFQPSQEVET